MSAAFCFLRGRCVTQVRHSRVRWISIDALTTSESVLSLAPADGSSSFPEAWPKDKQRYRFYPPRSTEECTPTGVKEDP
jgi:hypothetical protein